MMLDISVPEFEPADTSRVLARWKGGRLSLGDFVHQYTDLTPLMRPAVNDYWLLRGQVISTACTPYMADLARERGLDRDALVLSQVQRRTEELMVEHLYQDSVESKVWVKPEERRAYYEKNKHQYVTFEVVTYGALACDRKSEADSVAAQLRGGLKFADLLAADSLLGIHRGSIKEIRENEPGGAYYKLLFSEMRPGQVTVEGPLRDKSYLVMQGLSHPAGKQLSFEEAQEYVDQSLQNLKAEALLNAFLERLKKRYPVVQHPERVIVLTVGKMPRTRSGLSSYSWARWRMPEISSTTRSINGFLHSRQPMPALRQPWFTHFSVSSLE